VVFNENTLGPELMWSYDRLDRESLSQGQIISIAREIFHRVSPDQPEPQSNEDLLDQVDEIRQDWKEAITFNPQTPRDHRLIQIFGSQLYGASSILEGVDINQNNTIDSLSSRLNSTLQYNSRRNFDQILNSIEIQDVIEMTDRQIIIKINFNDLENKPLSVIDDLHQKLSVENKSANDFFIIFKDKEGRQMEGIDQGGLSRDFITRLFSGLVSQESSNLFIKNTETGELTPFFSVNDLTSDEVNQALGRFEVIGRLMGICLSQPQKQMRIGPVFSQPFFNVIKGMTSFDPHKILENSDGHRNEIVKLFRLLNEENHGKICDLLLLDPLGDQKSTALDFAFPDRENDNYSDREIKDAIYKNYEIMERVIPILYIYLGMINILGSLDEIKNKSSLVLCNEIQGFELSKESLLLEYPLNFNQTIKSYLEKWIQEASDEEFQRFVYMVTGLVRTPDSEMISIAIESLEESSNYLFSFHTCGQQIEINLKLKDLSYEQFKEAIELSNKIDDYNLG
jgi:hypothetical protein